MTLSLPKGNRGLRSRAVKIGLDKNSLRRRPARSVAERQEKWFLLQLAERISGFGAGRTSIFSPAVRGFQARTSRLLRQKHSAQGTFLSGRCRRALVASSLEIGRFCAAARGLVDEPLNTGCHASDTFGSDPLTVAAHVSHVIGPR